MTLQEAYNLFESLKSNTANKSEIKVYAKFLHILTELKTRAFSKTEILSIEQELGSLNLNSNPENKRKYYSKVLNKFENYLKETFSLTPKRYYTILGIVLGPAFGVLLGVLLEVFIDQHFERSLGISLGISIGLLIGLFIGQYMDAKVKAVGNML